MRGLSLPSLDSLAAFATDTAERPATAGLLTPWQAWLLQGAARPNLAALYDTFAGSAIDTGEPDPAARATSSTRALWVALPVHCAIGLDHLDLTDPAELELAPEHAASFATLARPLLAEAGWTLHPHSSSAWLLERSAHDRPSLVGAAPDCAIGKGIGPWLPRDGGDGSALAWQRVSTEIQMAWHDHPVNRAREAMGMPAVNTLWLAGTGQTDHAGARLLGYAHIDAPLMPFAAWRPAPGRDAPPRALANATTNNTAAPRAPGGTGTTGATGAAGAAGATGGARTPPDTTLVLRPELMQARRRQDWSHWRNALQALDADLRDPLAALRAGQLDQLILIRSGADSVRSARVSRGDLWKFWRRGKAVELFADAA